jgi:hypothetical protein
MAPLRGRNCTGAGRRIKTVFRRLVETTSTLLPTCNQKSEITAVGRRKGQSKAERALQHPGGPTRHGYEGAPLAASKKQRHSPRIEDPLENAPAASSWRWPQTRLQGQSPIFWTILPTPKVWLTRGLFSPRSDPGSTLRYAPQGRTSPLKPVTVLASTRCKPRVTGGCNKKRTICHP